MMRCGARSKHDQAACVDLAPPRPNVTSNEHAVAFSPGYTPTSASCTLSGNGQDGIEPNDHSTSLRDTSVEWQ
jgi:hypothetical protein